MFAHYLLGSHLNPMNASSKSGIEPDNSVGQFKMIGPLIVLGYIVLFAEVTTKKRPECCIDFSVPFREIQTFEIVFMGKSWKSHKRPPIFGLDRFSPPFDDNKSQGLVKLFHYTFFEHRKTWYGTILPLLSPLVSTSPFSAFSLSVIATC